MRDRLPRGEKKKLLPPWGKVRMEVVIIISELIT
jgi:hypothetical protein